MDMKRIYLIVGTDQEGDACWNVAMTLNDAKQFQRDMGETCFEPPAIFRIDTETLATKEVNE